MPQRKCIVGYFKGIKPNPPLGVSVTILPKAGEMFEIPAFTEHGPVTILFIMAIPNRELDIFKTVKYKGSFMQKMIDTIKQYFPDIYNRMEEQNFLLCDDKGFFQTAITPVIRKPYIVIKGKLIVGWEDSVFLNDPITVQGCNLASYCVEQLYETLIQYKDANWNHQVGESYWNRTKQHVKEVTEWTNAMLQPLPQHVVQLLLQAANDRSKADCIAEWFEQPGKAYRAFFQVKR